MTRYYLFVSTNDADGMVKGAFFKEIRDHNKSDAYYSHSINILTILPAAWPSQNLGILYLK
jgi:hypothetical protein